MLWALSRITLSKYKSKVPIIVRILSHFITLDGDIRPTENLFLRRNLFACPKIEAAYEELVCPVLEYGSSVWDPHNKGIQEESEKVQNHAARFVTRNYTFEEGSTCMTGMAFLNN